MSAHASAAARVLAVQASRGLFSCTAVHAIAVILPPSCAPRWAAVARPRVFAASITWTTARLHAPAALRPHFIAVHIVATRAPSAHFIFNAAAIPAALSAAGSVTESDCLA